ncbi:Maf family protein [Lacimicrobium alkaliphilum]|uniref:7-methyl-GTP pyrophosphatase n=1 Tax=Lacimicrobium alkaliphilum TaxID=1526571 RepID=A0ABQ1RT32_9ALTE|nr:nucleoside triphosphate pyrophosphatase [Lacimicrobium alkaliphilum]GGD78455.1 Maf-like protein [Lacimicrobium alkaliphilum]
MKDLILASTSVYRKTCLEKLGLPFSCDTPHCDETPHNNERAEQLVTRLALKKAESIAHKHHDALIIGSDQVACIEDEIIGKPLNHDTAIEQLSAASGKTVRFYTGLCLFDSHDQSYQLEVETFDVVFRKLSQQQIEGYLRKEQPYYCAGSFKSEGLGICLFKRLQGRDPNTLVGLPLILLSEMLRNKGIDALV